MLSCKIADSLGNFDAVKIATFHTWNSGHLKSSTVLLDVKVGTSSEEQKHVRKYNGHNRNLEFITSPGKQKSTTTEDNDRHNFLYLRSRNVLLVFSLLQTQINFAGKWKHGFN